MSTYALVPARGGSKSIPLKNIRIINGKPLIWWVLSSGNNSCIDRIFVATDNDEIKCVVENFGFDKVEVIGRSPHSAMDNARTEILIDEFCRKHEFDDLVVLQPTSPMITHSDIDIGIKIYKTGGYDSMLPVVRQKKFIWKKMNGNWVPTNFDNRNRPMRQDFDGYFVENGYFYMMSREGFMRDGCRLFGKIGVIEFPEYTLLEPDEPDDWPIVESILKKLW